jgi:hypothetical protein
MKVASFQTQDRNRVDLFNSIIQTLYLRVLCISKFTTLEHCLKSCLFSLNYLYDTFSLIFTVLFTYWFNFGSIFNVKYWFQNFEALSTESQANDQGPSSLGTYGCCTALFFGVSWHLRCLALNPTNNPLLISNSSKWPIIKLLAGQVDF